MDLLFWPNVAVSPKTAISDEDLCVHMLHAAKFDKVRQVYEYMCINLTKISYRMARNEDD